MKSTHLTVIVILTLVGISSTASATSGNLTSSFQPPYPSTANLTMYSPLLYPALQAVPPDVLKTLPPLEQSEHGVMAKDITCSKGLQLIFKAKDSSPACVRLETAVNLVDRGSWIPTIQTVWFVHYSSETTPWLTNIPSDISLNHTEQCAMADSTWKYLKSQGVTPLEILWTWPNLIATPEGVAGQHPVAGFLVHVLPNESSTMNKLGFKERSDVYYPLDLSLTPRLSICNDSGKAQSLANSFGSENHLSNTLKH